MFVSLVIGFILYCLLVWGLSMGVRVVMKGEIMGKVENLWRQKKKKMSFLSFNMFIQVEESIV